MDVFEDPFSESHIYVTSWGGGTWRMPVFPNLATDVDLVQTAETLRQELIGTAETLRQEFESYGGGSGGTCACTEPSIWEKINKRVTPLRLTINAHDGTFEIPTDSPVLWLVDWGDGNINSEVIHNYASPGVYTVKIYPMSPSQYNWLAPFGFRSTVSATAGLQTNRDKIIGVGGQITPSMVATEANIALGKVGNGVCFQWFDLCKGLTTMDADFGFSKEWDSITSVGNDFLRSKFASCTAAGFAMNDIYNLPQAIQTCGSSFCRNQFGYISSAVFKPNDIYNLPQGLLTCGTYFCYGLFYGTFGAAFTMNDVLCVPSGLVIPSGTTYTLSNIFYDCARGKNFLVNNVWKLPVVDQTLLDATGTFSSMFRISTGSYKAQTRTAASIINGNLTPTGAKNAFGTGFPDYSTIHANWKG
jgi:hypothetical protein